MSNLRETVTSSKNTGIDDSGSQVQQQTRSINTSASADSQSTISNIVWFIIGLVEMLLAFRFLLKLLGANSTAGFVDFIYMFTSILTIPFDRIFGVINTSSEHVSSIFEPSILVAAVVYLVIGWGIVKLITINKTA